MPVEVVYNGIPRSRKRAQRNAVAAADLAADTNAAMSRSVVAYGRYGGPHLFDSIEKETAEPRKVGKGVYEAVVRAGIEDSLVAWANEAGTGEGWDPPETEDPYPPSTAPDEWVYFNAKAGQFFTTSGNDPQPFMGPGYEAGREAAERAGREIHDA